MVDATLDLTDQVCPMTYVRTKLKLESLPEGAILELWLHGSEPVRNLPRSAREEGHEVLSLEAQGDGRTRLLIRKGARGAR
jgi:TusA-related sulfurtransferase